MLLSYTTSEEDNIPNLRIFAQNIRNNDEGPKLYEDTADIRVLRTSSQVPDFV